MDRHTPCPVCGVRNGMPHYDGCKRKSSAKTYHATVTDNLNETTKRIIDHAELMERKPKKYIGLSINDAYVEWVERKIKEFERLCKEVKK